MTKESPPFSFRAGEAWEGISIDLAREIARRLGAELELVEAETVEAMLVALEEGRADAAMAAVSVTPEREQRLDFSHPYFSAGLGVALRGDDSGSGLAALLRGVLSRAFLEIVGLVLLLLALATLAFYLAERRANPAFREPGRREALGFGFWWSTIILFGHKGIFPKTVTGRLLAASGMLASILLLSVLTGAIASVLTLSGLESRVRGLDDLRALTTVAVASTSGSAFLDASRVPHRTVDTPRAGLVALREDEADALFHDAPLLRHLVGEEFPELTVLERSFQMQDYAVAFPAAGAPSPWREPVNRALLRFRATDAWDDVLYRHLGR